MKHGKKLNPKQGISKLVKVLPVVVSVVAILIGSTIFVISHFQFGFQLGAASTPTTTHDQDPGVYFDHVVIIVMENQGYCGVVTTCGGVGKFETSLARNYSISGTCSNDTFCSIGGYTALSHPSEPNYCAMLGGEIYSGCSNDAGCCFKLSQPNLIDRLESTGLTWRAYAEDASNSGNCGFKPPARNHFPFLFFKDNDVASRCANFLSTSSSTNDSEFLKMLNAISNWPNFIWLTPNNNNNAHNTGALYGDNYLSNLVPRILGSTMFKSSRSALFIVYDEGPTRFQYPHDYLYASWSGPVVKHGYVGNGSYNPYSPLKTIEQNWGLASLTSNDANVASMSDFFIPYVPNTSTSSTLVNPPIASTLIVSLALLSSVFLVKSADFLDAFKLILRRNTLI
jgi:hypothetical protein